MRERADTAAGAAAAGAPGGVRSARQRVGGGARSRGSGASLPIHLATALRAGAVAPPGRRAHRAGAEASLARWDAGARVRATGVPGTAGGDDPAAGIEPADLPRPA